MDAALTQAGPGLSDGALAALLTILIVVLATFLIAVVLSRGRALRMLRALFRRGRIIRVTRGAGARARSYIGTGGMYVGTSGFAPLRRIFHPRTATERAIDEADMRGPFAKQAIDAALKAYEELEPKDRNIDKVVHVYRETEDRLWAEFRRKTLREPRKAFFQANKDAIRKQLRKLSEGAVDGEISFEDAEPWFDKLDYEEIGEIIDEDHFLYKDAFKDHAKRLEREGLFFKELSAKADFIRLSEQFDLESAKRDYIAASDFFFYDIPVHSDEDLLYEDIQGSLITKMMGIADKDVFFFLTRMRKTVNRNVMLLATLISFIISAFLIVNYWGGNNEMTGVPEFVRTILPPPDIAESSAVTAAGDETGDAGKNFFLLLQADLSSHEFLATLISKSLFAIGAFIVSLAIIAFFYHNPYTHYQNQNRVHLLNFMTTYSALLVSNYTNAESRCRGSFSGDQSGPTAMENSKIWFMNMQWIAYRLFFVETFLNSIMFQIKRNSGYYILGMPVIIILPLLTVFCWVPDLLISNVSLGSSFPEATRTLVYWLAVNSIFIVLTVILVKKVSWNAYLTQCVKRLLEIDDKRWKNFHNLDVQFTSAGLVRHFVGEIYNERMRVRGGGFTGGGG